MYVDKIVNLFTCVIPINCENVYCIISNVMNAS